MRLLKARAFGYSIPSYLTSILNPTLNTTIVLLFVGIVKIIACNGLAQSHNELCLKILDLQESDLG